MGKENTYLNRKDIGYRRGQGTVGKKREQPASGMKAKAIAKGYGFKLDENPEKEAE